MLEQMRQQSRSLLIYLLFSIVIVVFIVNFGPQSIGGCGMRMPRGLPRVPPEWTAHVLTSRTGTYAYTMLNAGSISRSRPRVSPEGNHHGPAHRS